MKAQWTGLINFPDLDGATFDAALFGMKFSGRELTVVEVHRTCAAAVQVVGGGKAKRGGKKPADEGAVAMPAATPLKSELRCPKCDRIVPADEVAKAIRDGEALTVMDAEQEARLLQLSEPGEHEMSAELVKAFDLFTPEPGRRLLVVPRGSGVEEYFRVMYDLIRLGAYGFVELAKLSGRTLPGVIVPVTANKRLFGAEKTALFFEELPPTDNLTAAEALAMLPDLVPKHSKKRRGPFKREVPAIDFRRCIAPRQRLLAEIAEKKAHG